MADDALQRRFLVGIDPAAETFTAALFEALEEGARAVETFANTSEGFEALEAWLADEEASPARTLVCIENTGVYSEALCYGLHGRGFALTLIAPYKIKKAFEDGPKNDRLDSQKIAEYGFRYLDKLRPWHPREALSEQIKTILTTREQLVKQKTASRNALTSLRKKPVQTPAALEALEATIDHLEAQIETLMQQIRRLIEKHPRVAQMVSYLISAPGVGLLMASHLVVLTNAFTQRARYRKLAARLGICPNEHLSGTSVWKPAKSRGYGPSMMRKLLHLAARSVITHEARFKRYYQRKLAEGKPRQLALNNVANKLLRILCGMLKNEQPYIENYQSINPRLLKMA